MAIDVPLHIRNHARYDWLKPMMLMIIAWPMWSTIDMMHISMLWISTVLTEVLD